MISEIKTELEVSEELIQSVLPSIRYATKLIARAAKIHPEAVKIIQTLGDNDEEWLWEVIVTYPYKVPRGRTTYWYKASGISTSLVEAADLAVERALNDTNRIFEV